MARRTRLHIPGAVYHVMLRGNAGQLLFFTADDYGHFYNLLSDGVDRFSYQVHAFCCMPNHLHLLVQVGVTPLSRIMQNLTFRYARWVNEQQGRTGHLFQGRYKALLIEPENYLVELTRYIHLTPVRARFVKEPADHPWSGHRAYIGLEHLAWLTTEKVLQQFATNRAQAQRKYRAFVERGKTEGHRQEFHYGTREGRLLGDDQFVKKILQQVGESQWNHVPLDQVLAQACQIGNCQQNDLLLAGKNRHASHIRALAAWVVREQPHLTLVNLSKKVGRDSSTLSGSIAYLLKRAEVDPLVRNQMADIKQACGLQ